MMADAAKKPANDKPVYFHLYFCPSYECLTTDNPIRGSMHQRGVHTFSAKPLENVRCPGCGGKMKIARNGFVDKLEKGKPTGGKVPHPKGHLTTDKDGNAEMHGDPILYLNLGQDSDDDLITKENADAEAQA